MRTSNKTAKAQSRPRVVRDNGRDVETAAELKARLNRLVEKANSGDEKGLFRLRRFLDRHPEVWEVTGNLTTVAERVWTEAIVGEDHLRAETAKRYLGRMRADLYGPHPTPVEKLLADQIVVAWLASRHAELAAAQAGGSPALATMRFRRAESAQKRYLGAVKLLTLLRAKMRSGLAPLNSVKIHNPAKLKVV